MTKTEPCYTIKAGNTWLTDSFGGICMSLKKVLGTKVSDVNYTKMYEFLDQYNKRTGKDLTMSMLIWEAIKFFVNHTIKSWK